MIPEKELSEIHVDSDGYVTCPDCGVKKKGGTAGVGNIFKNHRGTKICQEMRAKRSRDSRKLKDGSLLGFLKPRPKPVPTTVSAPPVQQISDMQPPETSVRKLEDHEQHETHTESPLVHQLRQLSKAIPITVPEGTENDVLSRFANPIAYNNQDISAEDLWEEVLNPLLKEILGWGINVELEAMIRRGKLGFDAVVGFVGYFVEKRGVSEALFEGKLGYLLECMKKIMELVNSVTISTQTATPIKTTAVEVEDDNIELTSLEVKASKETERMKFKLNVSGRQCKGYVLKLPEGRSPHGIYPFKLHDTLFLPWNYSVDNNVLTLFSHSCQGSCDPTQNCCSTCQDLRKNKILEGILTRIEFGIDENTPFSYHGIDGLIKILHRKKERIKFHGLLLRKATALDDHKRFLVAISSGSVERVNQQIRVALGQKKGIHSILDLYNAAARHLYHPKSFSEEDEMRGLLLWQLGGNRLASFGNKALGLPSLTTLRTRTIVPPIVPSHAKPSTVEIEANIEASFESILEVVQSQEVLRVFHAVLMFDEIATEKRIWLDRKDQFFLGVCREHGHITSLEFVTANDLEELFRPLDKDEIHYAKEATIGALGLLCDNNRIYPARAIMISGDCKKESAEEHATLLQTALDSIRNKREFINIRVVSLGSDGKKRHGNAMVQLTFKNLLPHESNIYPQLSPLVFMDLHVGFDDLTPDKDWKYVIKCLRNFVVRPRGFIIGLE